MSDLSDAVLRRLARLIRRAHGPGADGDHESAAARRELARLASRGLCAAPLPGEHADAASMVVREGCGCEALVVDGAAWVAGTALEVSDARAASAYLHEEWAAAWRRSQESVRTSPASASGWQSVPAQVDGVTVRMHFSGFSGDMLEFISRAMAPPKPADRRAFVLGLAQGAMGAVLEIRRRRGLPQRPQSVLVRDEQAEMEEKQRRVRAEHEAVARQASGPRPTPEAGADGQPAPSPPPPRDDPAAWQARQRARSEAQRREREFHASMQAGREAASRVAAANITLRLREMPTALPPHVEE